MCRRWSIVALGMVVLGVALPGMEAVVHSQQGTAGQQGAAAAKAADGKPEAKPEAEKVGSYSLVVATLEPTATTHWLNPPPTISVKGGTKFAPAETRGNLTAPQQYRIEAFGQPQQECEEAAQQQHGCDALEQRDLIIRDPNMVQYRIVSHGAPVQIQVNLEVHDLVPVSHGGASTDWRAGDVIFVSVPKATPEYRFIAETLVGKWNGEPIVFEAGKALPPTAKKALEDLGVHQDLGDSVLYSYRVK